MVTVASACGGGVLERRLSPAPRPTAMATISTRKTAVTVHRRLVAAPLAATSMVPLAWWQMLARGGLRGAERAEGQTGRGASAAREGDGARRGLAPGHAERRYAPGASAHSGDVRRLTHRLGRTGREAQRGEARVFSGRLVVAHWWVISSRPPPPGGAPPG